MLTAETSVQQQQHQTKRERKNCKGFPQFRYDPITTRITNTKSTQKKKIFHKK